MGKNCTKMTKNASYELFQVLRAVAILRAGYNDGADFLFY